MTLLSIEDATRLATRALRKAGAGEAMAASTARALVRAEAQGLASHGLSRVLQYATHLQNGRADGNALPAVVRHKGAALLVDAKQGLAFPACDLAVATAITTAQSLGVCFAGVTNSHHCGVLVDHLRAVADAGMVGRRVRYCWQGPNAGADQMLHIRHGPGVRWRTLQQGIKVTPAHEARRGRGAPVHVHIGQHVGGRVKYAQ